MDMFPNTSVDMFPITTGVETAVLIAIPSSQNTLRRSHCLCGSEATAEVHVLSMQGLPKKTSANVVRLDADYC